MTGFFLGCFVFGLLFTVASFLLGALGSGHADVPDLDLDLDLGGGHDAGGPGHGHGHHAVSPFSVSTISAFLAWFGGAGYLLARYSGLAALLVILLALAVGVVGGGIVFLVIAKLIMPGVGQMRPEEYRVVGAVGRVSSPIQPGGTGEVVYTLGGSRHADGARSVRDEALAVGTEVVIMRHERGIAWVERWDRLAEPPRLGGGMADQT